MCSQLGTCTLLHGMGLATVHMLIGKPIVLLRWVHVGAIALSLTNDIHILLHVRRQRFPLISVLGLVVSALTFSFGYSAYGPGWLQVLIVGSATALYPAMVVLMVLEACRGPIDDFVSGCLRNLTCLLVDPIRRHEGPTGPAQKNALSNTRSRLKRRRG